MSSPDDSAVGGGPATDGDPSAKFRLPRPALPVRYELCISPDLDAATFSGDVAIHLDVRQACTGVVLHAADLEITGAAIFPEHRSLAEAGAGGTEGERACDTTLAAGDEQVTFAVAGPPLAPGAWTLRTRFAGVLNDQLHGFYRSTFTDPGGASHTIATTQFEATDARRAFPCLDEPDAKAVFSVALDVPDGLTAVSNGAVVSEVDLGGGRRRVQFEDTPRMSTYLVAFIVGPLEATEPIDVDGVPLRVVHVPGKSDLTSFALETGAHALRYFTEYFGRPYPGGKLDLVAIPDFAFGAMENLGCVTFRESALLVDPARAARVELERVADVVSHEIAHMWFGDLVTMRWWNGLWLNEAFATFMELSCVDHFRPEWERWVSFGLEREAALGVDGLHTTRPVEFPVGRPEEAQGMFDVLTYQKGGSVLRMLEQYLGNDVFRAGIRTYLNRHAFANAETTDLWDALGDAAGAAIPVRRMMDSWIFQGGYPLVSVSAAEDADTVRLDQQPFSYGPVAAGEPSAIGERWLVPLALRAVGPDGAESRIILGDDGPSRTGAGGATAGSGTMAALEVPSGGGPVQPNAGATGFYRVSYDRALLTPILDAFSGLPTLERFQLVADTWACTLAGKVPVEDFLAVVSNLRGEEDPNVWAIAVGACTVCDRVIPDAERGAVRELTRSLLAPVLDRLGWQAAPHESEQAPRLRAIAIQGLGILGHDETVRGRAAELQSAHLAGSPVDPDLATAVAAVAADAGGVAEYEAYLARYRDPATPQDEMRYLYALAGFTDPELVQRTLRLCLGEVRTQNAPFLLSSLLAGRESGPASWRFVAENWDTLVGRFPDNTIPRMLDALRWLLAPPGIDDEVRSFLAAHPLRTGQRSVEQTLERFGVNVAFARREGPRLGGALAHAAVAAAAGRRGSAPGSTGHEAG